MSNLMTSKRIYKQNIFTSLLVWVGNWQRLKFAIATLLLQALFSFTALAQSPTANTSPIKFSNIAEKEVVTLDAEGNKQFSQIDINSEDVVPGDTIIYRSVFSNLGSEDIGDIVITNPIPANTRYIQFSASGKNTQIRFSIDGGKRYAIASQLLVTEPDGTKRPAKPSDYTHIRWTYMSSLAAGSSSSVSFKVKIL